MAAVGSEDKLREVVRAAFLIPKGVHQSWIETHATCPGFPDLEICYSGLSQHIELKVTDKEGAIKIRPTQYRWFKDQVRAGGKPLLWVMHSGMHYIFQGAAIHCPDILTNIAQVSNRAYFVFSTADQAVQHILK